MTFEFPELSAFSSAAARGNLVASVVSRVFDHETPVTLADRFVDEPDVFLLESATAGPGSVARFTFLGFGTLAELSMPVADGRDATAALRDFMAPFKLAVAESKRVVRGPDVAQLGGAIGWITYDAVLGIEPTVGALPRRDLGVPVASWVVPRNFFVLDHLTRRLSLVRYTDLSKLSRNSSGAVAPAELSALWHEERDSAAAIFARLDRPHVPPPLVTSDAPIDHAKFTAAMTEAEFLKIADACLEDIRAGEIFQIQIGNRLSLATRARPFDIFRHLRSLNPSPYMFYVRRGEHVILGASPEIMVGVEGERIVQRPIAGTRRRSWQSERDRRMREELVTSEKERAEHVMLVDLARNDIGRVATPGSVRVEELMSVEEYSHVFHMVSQVSGQRRSDVDPCTVLRASFPNGTVCGAPKIRAMQLINQREKIAREFYAGALGLASFGGDLKSTILIRSMHWKGGVVATQASAGIVYDSKPAEEWLETRNKMAACLTAMQNTLPPAGS